MQALIFQCPFCEHTAETTQDRLGEPVECPRCRKPFTVSMPTTYVKATREGEPLESRAAITLDTQPEEETLWTAHPAMFRKHPLWFVLCAGLAAGGVYGLILAWSGGDPVLFPLSIAALAAGGGTLLVWWIAVLAFTLRVTTERTILRRGILARRTSEVRHDDVRNLQVDQSLWERLFNVGDIAISSAGQEGLEIVARGIPRPGQIVKLVRGRQQQH
jgi:hypothetical protein